VFRRQFLRKMWSIQLVFLHFAVCRILLSSLTLCNTSSFLIRSVQLIFSSTTLHNCQSIFFIYFPKYVRGSAPYTDMLQM
jgi:hypothetical protein